MLKGGMWYLRVDKFVFVFVFLRIFIFSCFFLANHRRMNFPSPISHFAF